MARSGGSGPGRERRGERPEGHGLQDGSLTGSRGSKPFCEKGELHGGVRAVDHIAHPGHAEGCPAAGVAGARGCQPCYNGGSRNEPDGVKPGGEIRVRESAGLKLVALVPVGFFIF